jgi:hypothetical protein
MDGTGSDAPVEVARAAQLNSLHRAYTSDHVAFVDGSDLFVASLDGSDADAPVLVAKAPPGLAIDFPRWLPSGDRLTFLMSNLWGGSAATAWSASADGSEALEPVPLSPSSLAYEWVAGFLPDGRVVILGGDGRLHAVPATGGERIALTPPGLLASLVMVSP